MQTEHHQWWSPNLGRDMELKVYGYYGKPVVVFPAQAGRFFDYEGFQMIDAISAFIEAGKIKVYAVDSVDRESWVNWSAHPHDRARRHEAYDRYITEEVTPFIHNHCGGNQQKFLTTGCSMGGYHSANFFFRHPDIFDTVISISGVYQLRMFVGDYMDDLVYFNSPIHYLANLTDPWYLDRYRENKIIICCGQGAWEDRMLEDVYALRSILEQKDIPAWVDIWGTDVNHDWPWWRQMMPYFLEKLDLPGWSGG